MDSIGKLRRIESRLTNKVNAAAQKMSTAGRREPLEIVHAIVEAVDRRIEPAGRGKYVFPFNCLTISIAAPSPETRARFEAVFTAEPSLDERIVQTLEAAGCKRSALSIETTYVDEPEGDWTGSDFNIKFDRVAPASPGSRRDSYHNLKLTILEGAAEKTSYVFTEARINLGRCPEVRDHRNRLIRRNHVAFAECAEEPNLSVSRQHAHIDFAPGAGEYRLCDDRSAHGTSVLRNGETVTVPSGPRGIRLQSGDEITLGEARLGVEIEDVRAVLPSSNLQTAIPDR
jgi:hypothetical protein